MHIYLYNNILRVGYNCIDVKDFVVQEIFFVVRLLEIFFVFQSIIESFILQEIM